MRSLGDLLEMSGALHGHLCPGQVLGVRMATLGCRLVGIEEPAASRSLLVYVEIDRCAADAIQAVTGCKLGRRTLKYRDYGKLAATFVNVDTGEAVRVVAREDARDAAWRYAPDGVSKPEGVSKKEAQLHAYQVMPAEELFAVTRVIVEVPACDMPGRPVSRVICDVCGEGVNDRREVIQEGLTMCIPCARGAYYVSLDAGAQPSTEPLGVV